MDLRWEPALRMTPDEAMKHAWIQEPKIYRAKQNSRVLSDVSFSTLEKKKENIRKHVLPGDLSASVFGISLDLK